jgi:hypothetical protein
MLCLCLDKSAGVYLALNLAMFVSFGVAKQEAKDYA